MRYQHNSQKSEKKTAIMQDQRNQTEPSQIRLRHLRSVRVQKLGKIIQTPLYARPTPLDHQKTSPSFQRPPLSCYSPLTY